MRMDCKVRNWYGYCGKIFLQMGIKIFLILLTTSIFLLVNTPTAFADIRAGLPCGPSNPANPSEPCIKDYDCELDSPAAKTYSCKFSPVAATIGKIQAPSPLTGFLAKDPTGTGALSQFLSNLVSLIFSIAAVTLVFMITWGGLDWIISEGDKEKIQGAQKKIINALIGLVLIAAAFAILRVLGHFTGFTLFKGG